MPSTSDTPVRSPGVNPVSDHQTTPMFASITGSALDENDPNPDSAEQGSSIRRDYGEHTSTL